MANSFFVRILLSIGNQNPCVWMLLCFCVFFVGGLLIMGVLIWAVLKQNVLWRVLFSSSLQLLFLFTTIKPLLSLDVVLLNGSLIWESNFLSDHFSVIFRAIWFNSNTTHGWIWYVDSRAISPLLVQLNVETLPQQRSLLHLQENGPGPKSLWPFHDSRFLLHECISPRYKLFFTTCFTGLKHKMTENGLVSLNIGENGDEIIARLKRDLLPTMLNGVMYWPVCDFITFRFVPVHLQVCSVLSWFFSLLFSSSVGFGFEWCFGVCLVVVQALVSNSFSYVWTVYMTYMASLEKAASWFDPIDEKVMFRQEILTTVPFPNFQDEQKKWFLKQNLPTY